MPKFKYILCGSRNYDKEQYLHIEKDESECTLCEAAYALYEEIIKELGNGDGENGGLRSAKSRDLIIETLTSGRTFEYADCKFKLTRGARP